MVFPTDDREEEESRTPPDPQPEEAAVSPRDYVRAAREFCQALTEAAVQGFTLPPELSNLAALEMLCSEGEPANYYAEEIVARIARVYCFNVRRALDAGLESYQFLRGLNDVAMLQELARHVRAQIEDPPAL